MQTLVEGSCEDVDVIEFLPSGCNVTGMIVSFCRDIGKAPPLIDTFIVPRGADHLYASFEWGLTV